MPVSSRPAGVAVVGSINADVTALAAPLPRPGETVLGQQLSVGLGGKGANQAVAAARAGAPTYMVGAVGDDLFRSLTLEGLQADGIDVTGVAVLPGSTGVAHIRVDAGTGQNDIVVIPNANGVLPAPFVTQHLRRLAGRVSVVLVQLEIPLDVVVAAARTARELGHVVVLDPAPAQPLPEDLWPLVDIVTPNETEAEAVTGMTPGGMSGASEAGRWFVDRGVAAAVLTLGDRGVLVVTPEGTRPQPAPRVRAVDTTAGGDAFTGSLGAALAAGRPWEEAVRRAVATASVAVTRVGATASIPTAAEVDAFLSGAPSRR